jgi:hypothetical protein
MSGQSLAQIAGLITTTTAVGGGIWEGGAGLAADQFFDVYFATGNGTFDANSGGSDYGNSIVKLGRLPAAVSRSPITSLPTTSPPSAQAILAPEGFFSYPIKRRDRRLRISRCKPAN